MSNYKSAATITKQIEGGYCPGGLSCGGSASGETYRGIDRNYQSGWSGWQFVDQYKSRYGAPKLYGHFIKDATLQRKIDESVESFYQGWWQNKGFNLFTNQHIANLLYAFVIHRENAAMNVINSVARDLGARIIGNRITGDVAAALERNPGTGYELLRNAIIRHYNSLKNGSSFIKNRVNIFPNQIAKKAVGFWDSLFSLFKK